MDFAQTNYKIENISEIEKLDDFEDEYVYDVEVDDSHNFFANDILVHNSIYVEFGRVVRHCKIPAERQTRSSPPHAVPVRRGAPHKKHLSFQSFSSF